VSRIRGHDYDEESHTYDATRGGDARAIAAADALHELLPTGASVLDIGGGTGIVANFLIERGHPTTVVDSSPGMIRVCEARGTVPAVLADAATLPFDAATVDNATMIWLLHLVDDPAPLIAEVARVLRPGGRFITTVDKLNSNHPGHDRTRTDAPELISHLCRAAGFTEGPRSRFIGHGQADDPVYRLAAFDRL
jgi:ubiquinone/menaquinone biosynthesis C-methylase UbiE